ncbi:MAG: GHKL domain-containing protein, partial [candidate division Zixibacteria bacterium]|nr:GHKL domain-containing protein [candidate division Zixibacteria bacterium]
SLLDSFILAAQGRVGAKQAALFLPLKPGQKELYMVKSGGGFSIPDKRIIINQDSSFCLYIANLNRPIKISEAEDKFEISKDLGFIEYFPNGLVVPLVFQTKLRGILVLSEKESTQSYLDNDIEFISILSSQTAVSIENVRLFDSEKEASDKLKETQGLLLQSERSAALGELSAKIAHEINNPLGIIKNYLSLVDQNIVDADKSMEYTKIIKQEIDRIAVIVKQLLNFHRPVAVSYSRIVPVNLINEILSLMDRQFKNAGVNVTFNIDDNIPEIFAWQDGLKQVFMNLLVNSIDAMQDVGEIVIDLKKTAHTVIFSFEDSGPGIKAEHIPHIFDPYYTTKSASGGSGLGLSVCYNIIKNHNGSINYTNSKRGGCFIIELPIEQGENKYGWEI